MAEKSNSLVTVTIDQLFFFKVERGHMTSLGFFSHRFLILKWVPLDIIDRLIIFLHSPLEVNIKVIRGVE